MKTFFLFFDTTVFSMIDCEVFVLNKGEDIEDNFI